MSGERRPPIPESVKALVWDREGGVCQMCKAPVVDRSQCQFNHNPGLWVRRRNDNFKPSNPRHYIPNANDPNFIELVHSSQTSVEKCHNLQTFGNGVYRGDVTEAARTKRIIKKRAAEVAAKASNDNNGSARDERQQRPKMQSRPFAKQHRPMPGSRAHPSKQRKRMSGKVSKWE
jgi:hypothetical protein